MGNSQKSPDDYEIVSSYNHRQWSVKQQLTYCQIWNHDLLGYPVQAYELDSNLSNEELDKYTFRSQNNRDIVGVYHVIPQENQFLCSKGDKMHILTQRIPIRLHSINNLNQKQALHVLTSAYSGYNTIGSHYGPVMPHQNCIGFTELGKAKVWVNPNLAVNTPLQDQQITDSETLQKRNRLYVKEIFNMVDKRTAGGLPRLRDIFNKKQPTYFQALNILEHYTETIGIKIPPGIRLRQFVDSFGIHQQNLSTNKLSRDSDVANQIRETGNFRQFEHLIINNNNMGYRKPQSYQQQPLRKYQSPVRSYQQSNSRKLFPLPLTPYQQQLHDISQGQSTEQMTIIQRGRIQPRSNAQSRIHPQKNSQSRIQPKSNTNHRMLQMFSNQKMVHNRQIYTPQPTINSFRPQSHNQPLEFYGQTGEKGPKNQRENTQKWHTIIVKQGSVFPEENYVKNNRGQKISAQGSLQPVQTNINTKLQNQSSTQFQRKEQGNRTDLGEQSQSKEKNIQPASKHQENRRNQKQPSQYKKQGQSKPHSGQQPVQSPQPISFRASPFPITVPLTQFHFQSQAQNAAQPRQQYMSYDIQRNQKGLSFGIQQQSKQIPSQISSHRSTQINFPAPNLVMRRDQFGREQIINQPTQIHITNKHTLQQQIPQKSKEIFHPQQQDKNMLAKSNQRQPSYLQNQQNNTNHVQVSEPNKVITRQANGEKKSHEKEQNSQKAQFNHRVKNLQSLPENGNSQYKLETVNQMNRSSAERKGNQQDIGETKYQNKNGSISNKVNQSFNPKQAQGHFKDAINSQFHQEGYVKEQNRKTKQHQNMNQQQSKNRRYEQESSHHLQSRKQKIQKLQMQQSSKSHGQEYSKNSKQQISELQNQKKTIKQQRQQLDQLRSKQKQFWDVQQESLANQRKDRQRKERQREDERRKEEEAKHKQQIQKEKKQTQDRQERQKNRIRDKIERDRRIRQQMSALNLGQNLNNYLGVNKNPNEEELAESFNKEQVGQQSYGSDDPEMPTHSPPLQNITSVTTAYVYENVDQRASLQLQNTRKVTQQQSGQHLWNKQVSNERKPVIPQNYQVDDIEQYIRRKYNIKSEKPTVITSYESAHSYEPKYTYQSKMRQSEQSLKGDYEIGRQNPLAFIPKHHEKDIPIVQARNKRNNSSHTNTQQQGFEVQDMEQNLLKFQETHPQNKQQSITSIQSQKTTQKKTQGEERMKKRYDHLYSHHGTTNQKISGPYKTKKDMGGDYEQNYKTDIDKYNGNSIEEKYQKYVGKKENVKTPGIQAKQSDKHNYTNRKKESGEQGRKRKESRDSQRNASNHLRKYPPVSLQSEQNSVNDNESPHGKLISKNNETLTFGKKKTVQDKLTYEELRGMLWD